MAIQPTYPGVYIQEISSGVRTITGVSTSITAFIGRSVKGKPDEPLLISSYADYERMFGGLWVESTMSYAVRDFFLNGGSQAIIIRIRGNATLAEIDIAVSGGSPPSPLTLRAVDPGSWGNKLSVTISDAIDPMVPSSPPQPPSSKFNLKIVLGEDEVEQHLNVSMDSNDPRFLPRVLENRSNYLVALETTPINGKPNVGTYANSNAGNDGIEPTASNYQGSDQGQTGLYALNKIDIFNLLCIPPPARGKNTDPTIYSIALQICKNKRAMLLVDAPYEWGDEAASPNAVKNAKENLGSLGIASDLARNAMLYFPLLEQADPNLDGQLYKFVPCGAVAGIIAKTDATRGVWKAAAGIDAGLNGVQGLQINLTDLENGTLNMLGINCLRSFPVTGRVVWGARTMRGADQLADEYKYSAVRRTALFIEESLYRSTQWVVFEPNDEPLWAQIRLNIGAFMHNLFRQGAFQGKTPKEAYLVKCDRETTTQNDINLGIVNILVGFAPLKPAEFVMIKIQQLTGQIDS